MPLCAIGAQSTRHTTGEGLRCISQGGALLGALAWCQRTLPTQPPLNRKHHCKSHVVLVRYSMHAWYRGSHWVDNATGMPYQQYAYLILCLTTCLPVHRKQPTKDNDDVPDYRSFRRRTSQFSPCPPGLPMHSLTHNSNASNDKPCGRRPVRVLLSLLPHTCPSIVIGPFTTDNSPLHGRCPAPHGPRTFRPPAPGSVIAV